MSIDSDTIKRINIFPSLLKFNQKPRSENSNQGHITTRIPAYLE